MHPTRTDVAGAPPAVALAPVRPAGGSAGRERLLSLDVFRGITIAGMLLVNNPGSWSAVYDPLAHAEWTGWTPTDLIFPFFLFIVGVAMTFSFPGQLARGTSRGRAMARAAKRGAVLFALGLVLASFPWYDLDPAHLRIPGVLQRIGVCFVLASAVVLFLSERAQAVVAALLLVGYWAAMSWIPVPGHGAGRVTSKDGNLAAWVDRAVLGTDHLWKSARTWDPEGLLSTLPAVATVLLGAFAGRWLRSARPAAERTAVLLLAGNVGMALGAAWGAVFPVSKNLWTSSYVLLTGGMAAVFLAACYWVVDVRGRRGWARPFVWFGTNSIAAFFLSGLFARVLTLVRVGTTPDGRTVTLKGWIHEAAFASWLPAHAASLAFALCFVALWAGLMWLPYRRGIFLKV